jgi:hypothetical protein
VNFALRWPFVGAARRHLRRQEQRWTKSVNERSGTVLNAGCPHNSQT